jgi:hypothetical protein
MSSMDAKKRDVLGFRTWCEQPVRFVPTHEPVTNKYILPEEARKNLVIHVIHDGDVVPEELLYDRRGQRIPQEAFMEHYTHERDWGASLLAQELTSLLGLDGYMNIEIARVVMDFGRFPGITPKDADHLGRKAINYPFSELLGFEQKRRTLEHYYDIISERFNEAVEQTRVMIAIHSYDKFNRSGTLRPPASILTRCVGYQVGSEMPFGVFDPLYPDILGEFTCDRILRDRLSLTLERMGLHTEHNYPYLLPDGSVEVRSQVWNFFHTTRLALEAERPETANDPAFQQVWRMLLDTNLRSSESEVLRSYLHAFRRVPKRWEVEYQAARNAYEEIAAFLERNDRSFVNRYRINRDRPSALGLELRKDLIYDFDLSGQPIAPRLREVQKIAVIIAHAIYIYFVNDRPSYEAFDL